MDEDTQVLVEGFQIWHIDFGETKVYPSPPRPKDGFQFREETNRPQALSGAPKWNFKSPGTVLDL